jgi:hypothetical protein
MNTTAQTTETTKTAAGTATPLRRTSRWALTGLAALIGASAIYGGVGLMRDGLGMPADWLDGTPFDSWVLPGAFLLVVIALPMFSAAAAEVLRSRWSYAASVAAASAQLGWILAQVAILQRYFFLQPVLFVAGLLVGALAVWSHRGEPLLPR